MALVEALAVCIKNLKLGYYPNEQAISQGIVLRILHELGWDTYNPQIVWPEYSMSGRRVDFALCFPDQKPLIFIEVKQLGKGEGGDQQLFEYAYMAGIPMAVLTDGRTWSFYLPGEQGSFEERRVYKLDLWERTLEESAHKLLTYLDFQRSCSGQTLEEARKDYRDRNRRSLAKKTIPEAWKDLVAEEDPILFDWVRQEVENKCGVKPDLDDVKQFLSGLHDASSNQAQIVVKQHSSPTPPLARPKPAGFHQFTFKGQTHQCRNAKEVLVEVLRLFANADPSFAPKCANDPENLGRSRTYISNDPADLYPNAPHLINEHQHFHPDWVVATNLSNDAKEKVLKMACRVAHVGWNTDLQVEF